MAFEKSNQKMCKLMSKSGSFFFFFADYIYESTILEKAKNDIMMMMSR